VTRNQRPETKMTNSNSKKKSSKKELTIAIVLVCCIVFIAVWEIAAKMASTPFDELKLKPEDFSGFMFELKQWDTRLVHMKSSPTEPTVIGYKLSPKRVGSREVAAPLFSRIVHGYNMVDCMRIKQYKVKLVLDTRFTPETGSRAAVVVSRGANIGSQQTRPQQTSAQTPAPRTHIQVWKITSSIGEVSIWVTTMLRSADFVSTTVDTRDMAFPRVGSPDDPSWAPTGLKWSSLLHPIRNARIAIRSRWNSSRCDLLTFLRLRQPAWASDEMLTMVTEYHGQPVLPKREEAVMQYTVQAHHAMLNEFQKFWQAKKNED